STCASSCCTTSTRSGARSSAGCACDARRHRRAPVPGRRDDGLRQARQSEAVTLGPRVAVLRGARLQQCDTPRVLYERPANTFVAAFIGSPSMNLCTMPVTDGVVSMGGVRVPVPRVNGRTSVVVGLRPESLELAAKGVPARG